MCLFAFNFLIEAKLIKHTHAHTEIKDSDDFYDRYVLATEWAGSICTLHKC